MLAPARIPVAAGKKMANTEKNVSPFLKSGPKFSHSIDPAGKIKSTERLVKLTWFLWLQEGTNILHCYVTVPS